MTAAPALKPNILIIDDSESVRRKIIDTLKSESLFECVFEAKNGLQGFKLLLEKKVDLVICDLVMPEFDGFKFLYSKSTRPEFTEIPVIMLTSEGDVSKKVRGLEQGAQDYLTKPFEERELVARVKVHLKIKQLQDELRDKNQQLKDLSGTDELTGINNRRRFMEYFRKEFSRAKRYKHAVSFVILDVDFFKQVNDRYGHLFGDTVLKQIAVALSTNIRLCDVIGRYGGEEFTLLLPETNQKGAWPLAERIRKQIELMEFGETPRNLRITISGGVSGFPETRAGSVDELLQKADEALYRAKELGRNRIESAK